MTIKDAFSRMVADLGTVVEPREAQSIARIVFEDVFGVFNFQRLDELKSSQLIQLNRIQTRLLAFEPVQYVLGQADFFGLKLTVDPRVLIPRQETEELVDWILSCFDKNTQLSVLDIGTGSGCIPLALKKHRPDWSITGCDVSGGALEVAGENGRKLDLEVRWMECDILNEHQWDQHPVYDLVVSNPPYIERSEKYRMGSDVLAFEPGVALFVSGEDPLQFYRKIGVFATRHLVKGGSLFFELNEFKSNEVKYWVERQGFSSVELKKDLNGKYRMLRTTNPA